MPGQSATPAAAASPYLLQNGFKPDSCGAADSLTQQLEALKEAKSQVASQQAWSHHHIASRQDNARWEALGALKSHRLAEVLRKWPSPRDAEPEPLQQDPVNRFMQIHSYSSAGTMPPPGAIEQVSLDVEPAFEEPPIMGPAAFDVTESQMAAVTSGIGSSALSPMLAQALARQSSKEALGSSARAVVSGNEAAERDESVETLHDTSVTDGVGSAALADNSAWAEAMAAAEARVQACADAGVARVLSGAGEGEALPPGRRSSEQAAPASASRPSTARSGGRASLSQPGKSMIPQPSAERKPRASEKAEAKSQTRRPTSGAGGASSSAIPKASARGSPTTSPRGSRNEKSAASTPATSRNAAAKSPAKESSSQEAPARKRPSTATPIIAAEALTQQTHPEPSPEEAKVAAERCYSVMSWCADALNTACQRELRTLSRPPASVGTVLNACALLLGLGPDASSSVRKVITPALPEKLRGFKLEDVSYQAFSKVRRALASTDFDEDVIRTVCKAAVPLAVWGRAVGTYLAKTKFWNGPDADGQAMAAAPSRGRNRGSPNTSQQQQQQQAEVMEPPPQQSVVPSTNSGLVVEPDLARLSLRELREVSELTVSRPEVGSVTFHGITDCSDLDIERHVHLGVGEVLVYPEPGFKPPVGQGLNKRATVTMFQCWPPNGRSHLEDTKAQERYRWKIQQMTEEKRAKFIDYDCLTGIWKFQVEHF